MVFASDAERGVAQAVAGLVAGNPFLPERLEAERAALGDAFDPGGTLWHTRVEPERTPNVVGIGERATALAERARERLGRGVRPRPEEVPLYDALVLYALYDRYQADFYRLVRDPTAATRRVAFARPSPRTSRGTPRATARHPRRHRTSPTSSPASSRCGGRSTTSSGTSSGPRWR